MNDETWEPIDTEKLRRCYDEYEEMLQFFRDITPVAEGGRGLGQLFSSLEEYCTLPAAILTGYRIYREELAIWRGKHKMPGYGLN